MPQLNRRKIFSVEILENMQRQAYLSLLNAAVAHNTQKQSELADALNAIWLRIPKQLQTEREILLAYINHMIEIDGKRGENKQLESLIRYALKHHRDDALIRLYGLVEGYDLGKQLQFAENLLSGYQNDATALLTAGRLCLRNKLWGKARSYLEASVHAKPCAEAYNELGNLLEELGEQQQAHACYQHGLRLAPGCEQTVPIQIEKSISGTGNPAKPHSQLTESEELASSESEANDTPGELQTVPVKEIS